MKISLTILLSLLCSTLLHAQKTEVSIQANSGLFRYSGTAATSYSPSTEASPYGQDYFNNPYGSKNSISYSGDIQVQHVDKKGFIAGIQAGYEILRSVVGINGYFPSYYFYPGFNIAFSQGAPQPATGQDVLVNQTINISPYIGYRLQIKKIRLDLLPGISLGFNINSYDKWKGTDNNSGIIFQGNTKLADAPMDLQLKFASVAYYNKWGITVSYAHGLTNLNKYMYGYLNSTAHSELLSFGIAYKIL